MEYYIVNRLHFSSTPDDSNKVTGDEHHQVLEFTDEKWWARKDSNLRPMGYESTVLAITVSNYPCKSDTSKHLNPALV